MMDGVAFENGIAVFLDRLGFESINTTPQSGDYGVDIIAKNLEITYAFQCKYYSEPVGIAAVQEVFAGKQHYECEIGVVVTNSSFTPAARKLAKEVSVVLWDGKYLNDHDFRINNMSFATSKNVETVIGSTPGKPGIVTIEIKNEQPRPASLREVIDTVEFREASKSWLGLGLLRSRPLVMDLKAMHSISVVGEEEIIGEFLASILISCQYKTTPEEINYLICTDAGVVSLILGKFNGCPQLKIPVVTYYNKAIGALQWVTIEMHKRLRLFAETSSKCLDKYNAHLKENGENALPQLLLVVCVDEIFERETGSEARESLRTILGHCRETGVFPVLYSSRRKPNLMAKQLMSECMTHIGLPLDNVEIYRGTIQAPQLERTEFIPAHVSDGEMDYIINFIKNQSNNYSSEILEAIERASALSAGKPYT